MVYVLPVVDMDICIGRGTPTLAMFFYVSVCICGIYMCLYVLVNAGSWYILQVEARGQFGVFSSNLFHLVWLM